jgi:hypothetical protein
LRAGLANGTDGVAGLRGRSRDLRASLANRANGVARRRGRTRSRDDGNVLGEGRGRLDGRSALRTLGSRGDSGGSDRKSRAAGNWDTSLVASAVAGLGDGNGLVDSLSRGSDDLLGGGVSSRSSTDGVGQSLSDGVRNLGGRGRGDDLHGVGRDSRRLDRRASGLGRSGHIRCLGRADRCADRNNAGYVDSGVSRAVGDSRGAGSGREHLGRVDDRGDIVRDWHSRVGAASHWERNASGGEAWGTGRDESGKSRGLSRRDDRRRNWVASARESRDWERTSAWVSRHRERAGTRESRDGERAGARERGEAR